MTENDEFKLDLSDLANSDTPATETAAEPVLSLDEAAPDAPLADAPLPAEYENPGAAAVAESEILSDVGSTPTGSTLDPVITELPAPAENPVKEFADNAGLAQTARASVPAAYPFSLYIDGPLAPTEREKLVDLLSREDMGIREVDLEPQFESGRILIPRISEYAGVLLVQALRNTKAKMRLVPSDIEVSPFEIVAEEPRTPPQTADSTHPAESIVVTPTIDLPQYGKLEIIDTLTASATLQAQTIEVEKTREFQDILENLQRELKYKAHRKGAIAVTHFEIQLAPLTTPTHYRLIVTGVAVRPAAATGASAAGGITSETTDDSLIFPTTPSV